MHIKSFKPESFIHVDDVADNSSIIKVKHYGHVNLGSGQDSIKML